MRIFWRLAGSVLAVGLLAFTIPQVVSLLAHRETTITSTFDTTGLRTLEIDSDSGSVRLVGTPPGTRGQVSAHISQGLLPTTHRQRRIGNRLVFSASCPTLWSAFCSADYVVAVPRDVAVVVHTDNGSIRAAGLDAGADLETDDASITVTDLAGTVRLDTDDGDVTGADLRTSQLTADTDDGSVSLTLATPPSAVHTDTDNGSITLVIPDTTDAYRLDVSTAGGSVTTPVRTDPTSARVLSAHTDDGDVTIAYPSH